MSYTALYRTYRPNTFSDVSGQEHIVRTFKNALLNDKMSHAYLFSGPRGVGKTTIARIIAKGINCANYPVSEPCEECENCLAITQNATTDIIEVDAASHNGVEDIKNILSNVNLMPTSCKYKVYIIDEVHMLSMNAFNALLKTLEEPPSHVIFILATTEPHKIPATIHSRCQRFEFRGITIDKIVNRLLSVCEDNNIKVEKEALITIAEHVDGGMRDALSILDQVISYTDNEIKLSDIHEILGTVSNDSLVELLRAFKEKDSPKAITILDTLVDYGKEIPKITTNLINFIRDILVFKNVNDSGRFLKSVFTSTVFKELSMMFDNDELFHFIEVLNNSSYKMKYSSEKRTFLELAVIEICSSEEDKLAKLERKIIELEYKLANIQIPKAKEVPKEYDTSIPTHKKEEVTQSKENNTYKIAFVEEVFNNANRQLLIDLQGNWSKIQSYEDVDYIDQIQYLTEAKIVSASATKIVLEYSGYSSCNTVMTKSFKSKANDIFKTIFNKELDYIALPSKIWNNITNEYKTQYKNGVRPPKLSPIIDPKLKDEVTIEAEVEIQNEDSLTKSIKSVFPEDIIEIK